MPKLSVCLADEKQGVKAKMIKYWGLHSKLLEDVLEVQVETQKQFNEYSRKLKTNVIIYRIKKTKWKWECRLARRKDGT